MDKLIITISREFGSGGRLIGKKLAERLGINCYDRELIEKVSEESGLSPEFIENFETNATTSLIYGLLASTHTASGAFIPYDVTIGDRAFFAQSAIIRSIASKESCVIIGRCADYILRSQPSCVNVFIRADMEDKMQRAEMIYGMTDKNLSDRIARIDKGRANYYRHYAGTSWGSLRLYDLCINTSISGIDGAVDTILSFIKHRSPHTLANLAQ
ncbi:MAG: AAA family ATPase [Oscillospiraceae bacterium]